LSGKEEEKKTQKNIKKERKRECHISFNKNRGGKFFNDLKCKQRSRNSRKEKEKKKEKRREKEGKKKKK
jgi:hypothetical protein